ncbi:MAG: hypothetical protein GKR92_09035 [Gammaproteobacteria bacterium]|nr:MAG: hypothetical protein GKR92_09035 [Gammaproteobacteria bacterium]
MATNDFRENLISLLRTIASDGSQHKYEKEVSIGNVSEELICGWCDDLYHPNTSLFESAFNSQERRELDRFNYFFDKYINSIPEKQKLIDLQNSYEWKEIQSLASQTIIKCGWDE